MMKYSLPRFVLGSAWIFTVLTGCALEEQSGTRRDMNAIEDGDPSDDGASLDAGMLGPDGADSTADSADFPADQDQSEGSADPSDVGAVEGDAELDGDQSTGEDTDFSDDSVDGEPDDGSEESDDGDAADENGNDDVVVDLTDDDGLDASEDGDDTFDAGTLDAAADEGQDTDDLVDGDTDGMQDGAEDDGEPVIDCGVLANTYQEAIIRARQCSYPSSDPGVCGAKVLRRLGCPCEIFVNPANVQAMDELAGLAEVWTRQSCARPAGCTAWCPTSPFGECKPQAGAGNGPVPSFCHSPF